MEALRPRKVDTNKLRYAEEMKIIHVIPYFRSLVSGPSNSVWHLHNALERNIDEIWSLDSPSNVRNSPTIRYFTTQGPLRLGMSLGFIRAIINVSKNEGIIIHNHGLWMIQSLFPLLLFGYKVKIIQSPRGAFSKSAMRQGGVIKWIFWQCLQKIAMKRVNTFHATSEKESEQIRALGFKQPVFVVPNGISVPVEKPKKSIQKDKSFVYLGRFHPEKNLVMLISAWEMSGLKESTTLTLYGEGDLTYVEKLKEIIAKKKIKNVHIKPPIFGAQKDAVLLNSTALLFPSLSENFAMSIAEALAQGTPVVCTHGTPWKLLNECNAGYWIVGEAKEFASSINDLEEMTSEVYDRMSNAAYNLAQEFDWHRIAVRYLDYVENSD